MRENPKPFEVYRHFKGNLYQILTLATDSESGIPMVVYQAMYDDFKVYVRPLEMFMSQVDKDKYPHVSSRYRFEKVDSGETEAVENPPVQEEMSSTENSSAQEEQLQEELSGIDPLVLEFLEAGRIEERLNILSSIHHRITDDMINTMAVVMDVEINEGSVEDRYQELKNCLLMKQKFEKIRY